MDPDIDDVDPEIEAAWNSEIARRVREVDAGEVELDAGDVALRLLHLRKKVALNRAPPDRNEPLP